MEYVYLDNASSTPLCQEAKEALREAADGVFANPSAIHRLGQEARKRVEAARRSVAALLHADPRELVFTSGATEANNLAIRGVLGPKLAAGGKIHAVTTAIEHSSVIETLRALERRGLALDVVAPKGPSVRAEDVLAAVRPETALVSVMMVNNETGSVQPVAEIARGLRKLAGRVLLHADAVQGLVSQDVDVRSLGADLLAFSGHKVHAPKGVGALWVRRGLALEPQATGGGHESGRRSGTENVPGILALGAAAERLSRERRDDVERYRVLRQRVLAGLAERRAGAKPLFASEDGIAPNILSLECPGRPAEETVIRLGAAGVMAATGSACKSGGRDASPILLAMGVPKERARTVIRVSFGALNEEQDADRLVDALSSLA